MQRKAGRGLGIACGGWPQQQEKGPLMKDVPAIQESMEEIVPLC